MLLSHGYWRLFSRLVDRPLREADHSHLVPRSRMLELYLKFLIRLHGVVFNYLTTGKTLPFIEEVQNLMLLINSSNNV
jgi:hypothetical protein